MMHDFPYSDLHELNLDWFLDEFKKLKKNIKEGLDSIENTEERVDENLDYLSVMLKSWEDVAAKGDYSLSSNIFGTLQITSEMFIVGRSLQSNGGTASNENRSVSNYIFCPAGSLISVTDGYRFNIGLFSNVTAASLTEYRTFGTDPFYISSDTFVRFTLASNNDETQVIPNDVLNVWNGIIIKPELIAHLHSFSDLATISMEPGGISTTGANITGTQRMRSVEPVFLRANYTLVNTSGVKITWRRYTDAEGSNMIQTAEDFVEGNIIIPVSGYYRFVFQQNYYYNGILSLFTSLTSPVYTSSDNYPVLFNLTSPYEYEGSYLPMDIINGSGDMLTTLYGMYDSLIAQYPGHITKTVLGKDQSNTYDIVRYTITSYPTSVKPKIIWIAGIHASEPYTITATYLLVKELLENHYNNKSLEYIWSNCALMVIPVANPYGLANGGLRYNSRGVNLNRNFPVDWVYDSSEYDSSGSEPASEAETKIIMSLIRGNMDAIFAVNKHDSDTFSSQGYRLAYDAAAYAVDRYILRCLWASLDSNIKARYAWILENVPTASTFNLFRNFESTETHGTLDKWFNAFGMHGCLFESSRPGTDFTSNLKGDFLKICLETSVNMITSVIEKNEMIKDDMNKPH